MEENRHASEPQEQAVTTRRLPGSGHERRGQDRPGWPGGPYEPAPAEAGLLPGQVPGHRWNGWRRLTGDEDYYAACSCGWRSTETGCAGPMLVQVRGHLDAVRAVRGWRPAPGAARAPGRPGPGSDAGEQGLREQRARDLYATVEDQQRLLAQTLEHSTGLLAASEDQADRLAAALQHAAARVAPDRVETEASARRAEVLRRRADRAKEVRDHIIAAAATLAAVADEVALLGQDREAGHEQALDWIYGERLLQPTTAQERLRPGRR
jgi:hypothetical protein